MKSNQIKWMFYRLIMRLAHRFDWHYAPLSGVLYDGDYHVRQRWCQWCGLRATVERKYAPMAEGENDMPCKEIPK